MPLPSGTSTYRPPEAARDVLGYPINGVRLLAADGETLVIVVNVRDREVTLPAPEGLAGSYASALGGDAVTLGDTLTLAPYAYHVLRAE